MSIINDALKKARRESVDAPPTYTDDSSAIHPQRRTSSKPSTWIVLPILLLVLFSIALSIVLGYLAYQEFYLKKDIEKTAPREVPTSPTTPQPETKSPADKPPPAPVESPPISTSTPQTAPTPANEPAPEASFNPLAEFEINGVMRGGSSVRIITNSGVYRAGDTLKSPAGFTLQSIEDTHLVIRAPDGEIYQLPLP